MSGRIRIALSVQQPWAWAICSGLKPVENRSWRTKVRGWIGIHAGQKFDHDGYEFIVREFLHAVIPAPEDFQRGGIVGRARLTDCVEDHDSPWFFGPYGFVLEDARHMPFMPSRGKLGFFCPEVEG